VRPVLLLVALAGSALTTACGPSGAAAPPEGAGWVAETRPPSLAPPPLPARPPADPLGYGYGSLSGNGDPAGDGVWAYATGPVRIHRRGAAFSLWPDTTYAPVRVRAVPAGAARVCPARRGACRVLGRRAVPLPRTGDAPVAFRVEPVAGRRTLLRDIRIRWEGRVAGFVAPEPTWPRLPPGPATPSP
jgi:hypothetical protein